VPRASQPAESPQATSVARSARVFCPRPLIHTFSRPAPATPVARSARSAHLTLPPVERLWEHRPMPELLQGTLDLLILQTLVLGPAHGHTIAHVIEHRS